jgi:hypothetical protein
MNSDEVEITITPNNFSEEDFHFLKNCKPYRILLRKGSIFLWYWNRYYASNKTYVICLKLEAEKT